MRLGLTHETVEDFVESLELLLDREAVTSSFAITSFSNDVSNSTKKAFAEKVVPPLTPTPAPAMNEYDQEDSSDVVASWTVVDVYEFPPKNSTLDKYLMSSTSLVALSQSKPVRAA
jgi:hypothetical protein